MILRAEEFAESEGIRISRDAAAFLARSTGGDLLLLKNEIKKLSNYLGSSGQISLEDCHAVCTATKESLVWEFSSALAERDIQRALLLIPGILLSLEQGSSNGNAELAVLSSTANEFKRLMDLKCAGSRYGFPQKAGPNFFYATVEDQKAKGNQDPLFSMNPYRLFKMWENASRFEDREFADIFDALFTANRAMVTGAGDPRLILENLIMTVGPGKNQ
jgi:DNA polymerase III delta subunit